MKYFIELKKADKITEKDLTRLVPFVKLLKVEEKLNIEFEKQIELKGKDDRNVIQLHVKHVYLSMLILTPTVWGEYQFIKFTNEYETALKIKIIILSGCLTMMNV